AGVQRSPSTAQRNRQCFGHSFSGRSPRLWLLVCWSLMVSWRRTDQGPVDDRPATVTLAIMAAATLVRPAASSSVPPFQDCRSLEPRFLGPQALGRQSRALTRLVPGAWVPTPAPPPTPAPARVYTWARSRRT